MSKASGEADQITANEVIKWLEPCTVRTLGSLANAPTDIINATFKAMPSGSQAAMQDLGIASSLNEITDFGREVIGLVVDRAK